MSTEANSVSRPPASSGTDAQPGARWSLIRIAIVVSVLALLLAAGILPRIGRKREANAVAQSAEAAVPVVTAVRAKVAPSTSELSLPGNTEAFNVASIYARANGYVRQRMVDIGTRVKAGQVLAVIESPEVDQELAQARANLQQARAAVEQAQANLEQARAGVNQARANIEQAKANEEIAATTHQRWERLVVKGVLPKQSGDERRSAYAARQAESSAAQAALKTAEANVVSRQADVHAAEANVQAQIAQVRRLERQQGFERVIAPFDGVITERRVEQGDLITAGSGGDRSLFSIAQAKTLRIQANVPQAYAVDLQVGQPAEVTLRERPGQVFEGTVARTAQALNASSRTLLTEVQLDNSKGELFPGMYAQVKFVLPRSRQVVAAPANALLANAQGTRVVVLTGDSKAHFVPVQVGRDLGTEVEILAGLRGNELLVINPPDGLVEGGVVKQDSSQNGNQPGEAKQEGKK